MGSVGAGDVCKHGQVRCQDCGSTCGHAKDSRCPLVLQLRMQPSIGYRSDGNDPAEYDHATAAYTVKTYDLVKPETDNTAYTYSCIYY